MSKFVRRNIYVTKSSKIIVASVCRLILGLGQPPVFSLPTDDPADNADAMYKTDSRSIPHARKIHSANPRSNNISLSTDRPNSLSNGRISYSP